jgi:DNA-binding MarR family transcriptional regulator
VTEEGLSFLFSLYTANQAMVALVDETVEPFGVADGFAAMGLLSATGHLTPTALAQQLGMGLSTTSALIRRLLDRGHVRQQPNPNDGRSYLLELTVDGRAAFAAAQPAFRSLVADIERALTHSPADVVAVLADLKQAMAIAGVSRLAGQTTPIL